MVLLRTTYQLKFSVNTASTLKQVFVTNDKNAWNRKIESAN